MEPGEFVIGHAEDCALLASHIFANPSTQPHHEEHFDGPMFDLSPAKKNNNKVNSQASQDDTTSASLSKCYVFKSRLQEYAQKAGLKTPVYETIKEGPSHEPYFRSTVIVNDVRYDSLPGFFNRKAAEQSAAEIALIELAKSSDMESDISLPVHQTGLCKNLLQEYTQKMNYAIPLYQCYKEEKKGNNVSYYCVVEIGGVKYVGASANTKKEAEIKAARTALLAIQSAPSDEKSGSSIYTVVPCKKETTDPGISSQETAAALKPKKARPFNNRKHWRRKKYVEKRKLNPGVMVNSEVSISDASNSKVAESGKSLVEIKVDNCSTEFQNGCQEN